VHSLLANQLEDQLAIALNVVEYLNPLAQLDIQVLVRQGWHPKPEEEQQLCRIPEQLSRSPTDL